MKRVLANTFESDLDLDSVYKELNQKGPWKWGGRDSEDFGEYLSSVVLDDYGWVKLYRNDDGSYLVNLMFNSPLPDDQAQVEFDKIHDTLYQSLLPAIGAKNLQPSENVR